jgi:hypothetical protein
VFFCSVDGGIRFLPRNSSLLHSVQTDSEAPLPSHWVLGTLSPGAKKQGLESGPSPPSSAEV